MKVVINQSINWIEKNKKTLLFICRLIVFLVIAIMIVAYFVSGKRSGQSIYQLLTFSVSSGIFWLMVILIAILNVDIFKDIIKDIARSKVSEFVNSEYYINAKNKLLDDEEFIDKLAKVPQTGFVGTKDFSSGNKKELKQ